MLLSILCGSHIERPDFPVGGEANRKGGGKVTTDSQEYTEYLLSAFPEWAAGRKQENYVLCCLHGRTRGQDEGQRNNCARSSTPWERLEIDPEFSSL